MKNAVIVGYGAIGPVHAKAVECCREAYLYGICDCDAKKLELASGKHDCKLFNSFEDVLRDENVDVIHICTPHYLHTEMLIKAVKAKKCVVTEKPAAMNLQEINRIKALCGDSALICAILQNRFNPCVKKMKAIIDSGVYGKVMGGKGFLTWMRDAAYYAGGEWRGKWNTEGGGVVINQSVHILDLLEYMCGKCVTLKASIDNRSLSEYIEVEDTAEATLTTADGKRLLFYATNAYAVSSPFDIEIQLENAVLKYSYNRLFLIKDRHIRCIAYDSADTPGKDYWGKGHIELIGNFYSSLCGKAKPYTSIGDGLDAARLVDAVYRSAKSGQTENL